MLTSVQKVTRILTAVASGGSEPMPLFEIAQKTEINKATCSHIINTLMQEGFIVRISATKGYVLGPAAYCLSEFGRYGSDLISACRPVMQYLYKALGHCVVLAVIEGGAKYIIDYIDNGNIFPQKKKIRKDDIYRTATGRAILKNMSDGELHEIWEKYGSPSEMEWGEIVSFDDLLHYRDELDEGVPVITRRVCDDHIDLAYAVPIKRGLKCLGAIGIAIKICKNDENAFMLENDKKIKKLLIKGSGIINERCNGQI